MTIPADELDQRSHKAVERARRNLKPVKRTRHELGRRKSVDPIVHLNVLSIRDPMRAREVFAKEVGIEIDVQAIVEEFEKIVVDAICGGDDTIEVSLELAEAVAITLKSAKRSRRGPPNKRGGAPRKPWRDRLTQASAIEEARALVAAGQHPGRVAHKTADKFKGLFKHFAVGTIQDGIQRRKPPRDR